MCGQADMPQHLILIVEDDDDTCTVYKAILQHHGHAALCATNGREGVYHTVRHRPDIVLMDVSMPVMDGIEATRRIREDETVAGTTILALTAHDLSTSEWREAGFDGYMQKPVEPTRLAARVNDLLAKRSEE